jgi:hypothetical protein
VLAAELDLSEVVPPMNYGVLWPLLGVLALLLVIVWFIIVPLIARRIAREVPADEVVLPRFTALGRAGTLSAIDEVERLALERQISVREAHIRFSGLVRSYASEGSLVDARTMTLTELRDHGMTTIANAVAQFYPIAFQEDELTELGAAPTIAREAVQQWN